MLSFFPPCVTQKAPSLSLVLFPSAPDRRRRTVLEAKVRCLVIVLNKEGKWVSSRKAAVVSVFSA